MAQVRHIVTAPGKEPVEFFAPEGADDGQLQQLASQALAQAFSGESFVTPVLDTSAREALRKPQRKLTQDEILAQQGDLTAAPENIRTRTADALTSALSGLGMSNAAAKAGNFTDDIYDWTPAAALESGEEAVKDVAGGRYGEAIGNAALSALDIVPELKGAGAGVSALAAFAGRNSRTANLDALRKAEEMLDQGIDRDVVRRETGWHRGPDGGMRYEISDQGLKVTGKIKDPQRQATAAANRRAKELGYKSANDIPWTKFDDVKDVERAGTEVYQKYMRGTPLPEVFSHPELEAAYDLGGIKVRDMPKGSDPRQKGAFNPETNTIYLKKGLDPEEARSVVAHEVGGHYTQKLEGFAGGGALSPDLRMEQGDIYDKAIRNRAWIQDQIANATSPQQRTFYEEQLPIMEKSVNDAAMYEGYRRLAGEVEARNVQTRLDWTPEQRAATPPWETQEFPDEEQFQVFRGEGMQLSADPPGTVPAANALARFHEGEQLPPNTIVVGNRLRSTVNSKGQPLGRDDEEIRNFWNWYGDSVTTDDNGLPKPWYHGSMRGGIESFERVGKAGYPSENTINAIGSWFTDDPNMSNIYAGASRPEEGFARYGEDARHGGTNYPVYLRMQNPRPLRGPESGGHDLNSLWQQYAGGNTRGSEGDVDAFREYLSSHGYDSLWGKADDIEGGVGFGDNRDARYAIIPDPTQIKSVFNSGSFNPDDSRIMYDMAPPELPQVGPSKQAMATAKKLSTMAGSPAGANKKATTRQIKKLSEDYLRQVDQGKAGADWYEQSGRSIMEHMGENEPAAVKLAGAIGVTSARTPVLPNLEHGIRGHYQVLAGDPVRTGGFPTAMGKDIQKIYDAPDIDLQGLRELGNEAFGPKRTPFIQQNLMYEGFEPGQQSTARAVHDIWDMRARGYAGANGRPFEGTPSTAQHRWADLQDQGYLLPEANARQIGGRTDWDTGRAQAAAWVGNKIDALMREGKSFEEAQKIAVTDYSHGWDRLYANHSWESAPGSNTGHMAGFDDLPWEAKKQYHGEVETAFLSPDGRSNIALGYGMPAGRSYDATGLYEGVVSPGTQDLIPVARGSGSQEIDPSAAKMMNVLAATQGILGAQKGAAWNFQSPAKSSIKDATGFRFDMDRTMSLEDIERFGPMIQERFPAGNVGLLPDPAGMKVVKFWDEEGDDLPGFIRDMTREGGLAKPFPTTQSGNYMENAWDTPEGRFGGQYVNVLRGLDIPGMERKFDSFAPTIASRMLDIDPLLMKEAGLTGSADIERMRKTIANEGWQGLVKLVESQKGSVEAKAALLAAVAGLAGVGAGGLLPDEAQQ